MYGQLLRPRFDRKVAGVCAGFARAYGWDLTMVRLVTVLLAVFGGGSGLVAYIICWVVIPEDPIALPPYPPAAYPPSAAPYPPNPGSYPPPPPVDPPTVPPTA